MSISHRCLWLKNIQNFLQHWTARHWLEAQRDAPRLHITQKSARPIPPISSSPVKTPLQCELTILNEQGIHARPAAAFVRCARGYESNIDILKAGTTYSAKSILAVLTANLNFGVTFTLQAHGPDAAQALEGIRKLLGQLQIEDPPLSAEKTASQKNG